MTKTNFDIIKEMNIHELARLLIRKHQEPEYDYDWNEEPYFWGMNEYYETTDGILFDDYYGYEEAVEHEECLLRQEGSVESLQSWMVGGNELSDGEE